MEIELIEQAAQPVLAIRTITSVDKLPQIIGPNYMKIMAYLQSKNVQPAGVPYTAYYNMDMQNLDVEMGFPVSAPLPGEGEIVADEIHAGKYVTCMYKGPYAGMEPVYNEIFKWLAEKQLEPVGVFYEYYYNSPAEVPESELLTKIAIPVK